MAIKKVLTDLDVNNNAIKNLKTTNALGALGDAVNRDFLEENLVDHLFTATWEVILSTGIPGLNEIFVADLDFVDITLFKINKTDYNAFDVTDLFNKLSISDHFFISKSDNSSCWAQYVIQNITSATGHYNVTVALVSVSSVTPVITDGTVYKIHFVPNISTLTETGNYGITIDGSGTVINTGIKGYLIIPYNYTITGWSIIGDTTGSIIFDIWKNNSTIPIITDSITASAKPTLSSQQFLSSTTLTGWTTAGNINDKIIISVNSASFITKVTLTINLIKI